VGEADIPRSTRGAPIDEEVHVAHFSDGYLTGVSMKTCASPDEGPIKVAFPTITPLSLIKVTSSGSGPS
jgi:hypothetical protein